MRVLIHIGSTSSLLYLLAPEVHMLRCSDAGLVVACVLTLLRLHDVSRKRGYQCAVCVCVCVCVCHCLTLFSRCFGYPGLPLTNS